jgi:hypothetical protein
LPMAESRGSHDESRTKTAERLNAFVLLGVPNNPLESLSYGADDESKLLKLLD